MQKIYRGILAETLEDGLELPIGGSIFSDKLTTTLTLDFAEFEDHLKNTKSPEILTVGYELHKKAVIQYLEKVGSDVDPYLYFVCNSVMPKVYEILEFDPENPTNGFERIMKLGDGAKLSDMVGLAQCAEIAALGQYILQGVLKEGYESFYMSGVSSFDTEDVEDHSFIGIRDKETGDTYIFDIARQKLSTKSPRLLKTDSPFNINLFQNTQNLIAPTTDVIDSKKTYFGVGNPLLSMLPKVYEG